MRAAALGRLAQSHRLLTEAGRLALARPDDDRAAPFVLANWSQSLLAQGRWEAAEAVARGAADRAAQVDDASLQLRAWRIVAEGRRLTGRRAEAADALQRADAFRGLVPDDEAGEVAELDFSAGLLALAEGDAEAALLPLTRVVGTAMEREIPFLELRARLALSEALVDLGRSDEAEFELDLAGERAREPRARADVFQRRALLEARRGRTGAAEAAVEAMLAQTDRWLGDAPGAEEERARARECRGYVETALEVRLFSADAPRPADAWPDGDTWMRRVQGSDPTGPREGEADALWFWGARRVTGWLTDADGTTRIVDAGSPGRLREWALLFRSLLASPERADERDRAGRWLSAALFGGEFPRGDRLRLEPDGPLEALPFALLPDGDTPLGVARALVQGAYGAAPEGSPESRTPGCLVLADPTPPVGAPATSPLPGARDEARKIRARVPGTRITAGDQAMESRVAGATVPSILHVAAHSSPDPENPALLLAPGDGRDGWLRPDEIRGLPGVPQVVVLSSCESLLTDVRGRTSVGLVGSAFLDAGASTVVGALWKVEDGTPGAFMATFHAGLGEGLRPSESMRRARLTARQYDDPAQADPFSWGAYVVRGRDEPLRAPAADPVAREDRRAGAWSGYASALAMLLVLGGRRLRRR